MKTTVVCGLLGAGKTTFIQNYLKSSTGRSVVLVNDFGRAGIDGEIFSAGGVEAIELPSGCVCCTLKFDLITTIQKIIREFSPERLVIEPSGVAAPSGILEALDSLKISGVTVVGIIDATEFVEMHEAGMFGGFFQDQIRNSDLLLVNKVDLADAGMVGRTVSLVEGMNPAAVILTTVKAALDAPLPLSEDRSRELSGHHSHLHFDTVSVRVGGPVSYRDVESLFGQLAGGRYGDVVRAKALVQTTDGPYRFDLSFGKVDGALFGNDISDSRLVVIGRELDKDGVMAALQPNP